MERSHSTIPFVGLAVTFALTQIACGQPYYAPSGSQTKRTLASTSSSNSSNSSSNSSSSDSSSATDNSTSNTSNLQPVSEVTVRAIGYTAFTYSVQTRSVLKVRFSPGIQDSTVAGTGFSPQYSRMFVYIKVGTMEQPTPVLSNGYNSTAQQSGIMTFSGAFAKTCPSGADNGCRQPVTITVYRPNYDYWCLNYGTACPYEQVDKNHPWNGTLEVQTDDTEALQ